MNNEWTEESVLPHLFKMVQVSDDGIIWRSAKLVGFSYENGQQTFIMDMSYHLLCAYKFMRPIKEKKTIIEPWTFETCPWPLSLQHKGPVPEFLTFSTKKTTGVLCVGTLYTYEYLAEFFKQLDGSPCGIVKEADA